MNLRAALFSALGCGAFLLMSFSYQFGANPVIDYPRLLISDTQDLNHIFEDSEIQAMYQIQAGVLQNPQLYTAPQGSFTLPTPPVSYYRVAALLLDSLAANKSRLSSVTQLLDVHLSPNVAAKALREQAETYRDIDDNSGAFAIIEQVNNSWAFADRFWKQVQRESGV